MADNELIISYVLGGLNAGYFLVLTPSQYEYCPNEIKQHKNVKVSKPIVIEKEVKIRPKDEFKSFLNKKSHLNKYGRVR